ncbi:MAG: gamma-glutamyl-gamma-aminobutyrate hydrolase family protein, partial [Anaerolineae bacterium]|nr:gamma-glutamyl-gamma-aminobutyrate hydrolase family protein [Anaerolineae bacterium]
MAKQPHIGITTSYKDGRQAVDHYYISAVEKAGGLPIIVPMLATQEAAKAFASLLDGLIITGGPGITKGLIGTLPEDLEPVDPVRDQSDTLMYHAMTDKPVFGICYGMQLACEALGGKVASTPTREYGRARCDIGSHADLFAGLPDHTEVWMSHGDQVSQVSDDFVP